MKSEGVKETPAETAPGSAAAGIASGTWALAVRTAAVAGAFALAVCVLLAWNYRGRVAKDPLESPQFLKLKAELVQTTKDQTLDPQEKQRKLANLKEQIRVTDLRLREEYFQQRRFAQTGAFLLLGAGLLLLFTLRLAATLRRKMPSPTIALGAQDVEAVEARTARWAVAGLGAAVLALGAWLGLAPSGSVPGPSAAQSAAAPAPVAASKAGPADFAPDAEMAANWPCFRGFRGTGISDEKGIPTSWDAESGKNILWKTEVPLPGHGSPVIWGDRLFLSGASETARKVFCFDAAGGKLLWSQEVPGTPQSTREPPKVSEDTGYAASTTATDGRRVFAIFANGDLGAFDFDGKLVWARSLGVPKNEYGHASSLVTCKNLLVVQFDQGSGKDGLSKLMGLEATTGKTVWETVRKVPASWSTPIVARVGDQDLLVATGNPWVIAYNPADGSELWRAECLKEDIGPSPTAFGNVVYAVNNFPQLSALKADGRGDITKSGMLWMGEDGLPDTCSPLATERQVFLLSSAGTLTCYAAGSGELKWEKDFDSEFYASPGMAEGRIFLVGKEGNCWVVEPGEEDAKEVGTGELGEHCVASPAFAKGRLYLRGTTHLFAIGAK